MFRMFARMEYLLRETLLGIQRGGWMNWAAISTVAVLLFLFGASLQVSWQFENILGQMGNQLEISVYLNEGTSAETIQSRLALVEGVSTVQLITKEEAWTELLKDLNKDERKDATAQLGGNPLVDEFKVRAIAPERVPDIAKRISGLNGVDEVWYTNEVIERLGQLRRAVTNSGAAIVSIFTLIAIAVITTTIRLIVLARKSEIEVMQLVGATNTWIYLPFVFQGIVFGVLGAAIAYGMLAVGLGLLSEAIVVQPELIQSLTIGLLTDLRVQYLLPAILFTFGAALGVLGSLFAVHRISLNQVAV